MNAAQAGVRTDPLARPDRSPAVPAGAALLDAAAGEPRRGHPVRVMGGLLEAVQSAARHLAPAGRALLGAGSVAVGAAAAGLLARSVDRALRALPGPLSTAARAGWLKPSFSVRELLQAGARVRRSLEHGELDEARRRLGRDLVSRSTEDLTPEQVASGAVESLAEGLCDSVVAPLFWWRTSGTGGAWAYRFVNTADAMLGYRTPELLELGALAARADDAAGWVPARLSALLIALAAPAGRGDPTRALRSAIRDAGRTKSPNAGWPMAALAGAIDVRLDKPGAYRLHPEGAPPGAAAIARTERVVGAASALAVAATAASTLVASLTRPDGTDR